MVFFAWMNFVGLTALVVAERYAIDGCFENKLENGGITKSNLILYISALVSRSWIGKPRSRTKRLEQLNDNPRLNITEEVESFVDILIFQKVPLPSEKTII